MILKSIKLTNFRCHENYNLKLDQESTTQILGENGWGKTSILEAIYLLLVGKSFRAVDQEIFRRGADFYLVEMELTDGTKRVVNYDSNLKKKTFLVEDRKSVRLPKKYKYPVVLFIPEDLHLVGSSPTRKREFFDRILGQIFSNYSLALSKYNKALKQRNELLKSEFVRAEDLFSWDILMAKYGVEVREARRELISKINLRLTEVYQSIAENSDEVALQYESYTSEVSESEYLRLLALDFERDRATGHTNFGVHKDDYQFIFNGVLADGSASRGEVRSLVIALKFIEAELLFKELGKKPVVLLDDVFSELDLTRKEALVKNFRDNQVVLTSVG